MTQNSSNSQNQIKHTEAQNNVSNKSQQYQYQVYGDNSKSNQKVVTGDQFSQHDQQFKEETNKKQQLLQKIVHNKPTNKLDTNTPVIQSDQLQQYINYFSEVQTQADNHIKSCLSNAVQTLKHKMLIINKDSSFHKLVSFADPIIIISGNLYGGIIVKYQIIVGNYRLKVDLLNIKRNASNNLLKIGYGGYGSIYRIKYSKNKTIVAKRILFKLKKTIKFEEKQIIPNRLQIHESLCQYSIYKICSFYKIGPQIANELGFDVVCFENCLQFYMEECLRGKYIFNTIEKDLKLCLRVLHKIKIVHKDVKPANILFSYSQNRYVLCDFGISHPVEEQIGFKSKTYKQGSAGFMSPQMQNLYKYKQGYVDLYDNDLYGLKCSILEFMNHYQIKEFPQRIMFEQRQKSYVCINEQIYRNVYILNIFLKIKSKEIELNKQRQSQYIQQISLMCKHFFQIQISNEKQFTINQLIDLVQERDYEYCLQNLIRCYGLTLQLLYQLNKLRNTEKIESLKNRIKSVQKNNCMSEQKIETLKYIKNYNKYEFSLERQLLYYRYIEQQLSTTSFKQKILATLLEIFFTKIDGGTGVSHFIFMKLIHQIEQFVIKQDFVFTEKSLMFQIISKFIIQENNFQFKYNLKVLQKFNPNAIQKVYRYLIKFYTSIQNHQHLIIKFALKLQLIYKQNICIHLQEYLQLLYELTVAHQQLKKQSNRDYLNELKCKTIKLLNKIPESNSYIINCYRYLGICCYINQQYQQASAYYQKQLFKIRYFHEDSQSTSVRCYFNLMKCSMELRRLKEAQQYGKIVLDIIKVDMYYREHLKIQNQCRFLMCIISLLKCKEDMLIICYDQFFRGGSISRLHNKLQQDIKLYVRASEDSQNYSKQFPSFSVLTLQNSKMGQHIIDTIEIDFEFKFEQYQRQRYCLSKILIHTQKYKNQLSFLPQKSIELESTRNQLRKYIEQKLSIFFFKNNQLLNQQISTKLNFFRRIIQYHEDLHFQNLQLINHIYMGLSQGYETIHNFEKSIYYTQKRAEIIITHRQYFDKFQFIKCLLTLKKYYVILHQYTEAIYYFKTLMAIYPNQQLNFVYDILSQLYLYSKLLNRVKRSFNCKLKYYSTKKQKKNEKYSELKQLCSMINKKGMIHMIELYCIQFQLQSSKILPTEIKNKEEDRLCLALLKYNKNVSYLKKKAKLFQLIKADTLKESIGRLKHLLI